MRNSCCDYFTGILTIATSLFCAFFIYSGIKNNRETRLVNQNGNKAAAVRLRMCLAVGPMYKLQLLIIQNEKVNLVLNDKLVDALEKAKNAMMDIKMLVNSTSTGLTLKPTRKNIRLSIKNCNEPEFVADSDPIEMVNFKWFLEAINSRGEGWLGLYLHLRPPSGFDGNFRIEIDFALSILNAFSGKDIVLRQFRKIYQNDNYTIGHGWKQMAKIEDLMNATNGFIHPMDGSIEVEADFTIKSATLNHLDD